MEFKVIKYISEESEDESITILKEEGKEQVILQGDYYHNKIDDKISGFFEALDYLKIDYEKIEKEEIITEKEFYELFY